MELFTTFLSEQTIRHVGWVLVHFLWQGLAAMILMWVVLKILAKASSNVRYLAACVGLLLMVLSPIVTFAVLTPHEAIRKTENTIVQIPVSGTVQPIAKPMVIDAAVRLALPKKSLQTIAIEKLEAALPYCVLGWLVGVAGLSLWYFGGWCQLQKLRRIGTKIVCEKIIAQTSELSEQLGIRRAVRIAESAIIQVPTMIGWLRPVILLPATAVTGMDEIQLKAMIAHELAHIKRCDYLVNLIQTVVEILGFYHPCVWWMSKQIRIERENCCDDMAAELIEDRTEYAKALYSMEEIRTRQFALAVSASGSSLVDRIRRLVMPNTVTPKSGWIPSAATLLVIFTILVATSIAMSNKTSKEPVLPNNSEKTQKPNDSHPAEKAAEHMAEEILQTWIDFSSLTTETRFEEAITLIRRSTNPPLQIIVLWSSLENNAGVDRDIPIGLDGIGLAKLGTGLDVLLRSVAPNNLLTYQVRDDAVVISANQPNQQMMPGGMDGGMGGGFYGGSRMGTNEARAFPENQLANQDDSSSSDVLETRIDCSSWTVETRFEDAINSIRKSAKPSIQVIVLWSSLVNNAGIDRDTPIGLDGLGIVKLDTVLNVLLKSISCNNLAGYQLKDGVIIISANPAVNTGFAPSMNSMDSPQMGGVMGGFGGTSGSFIYTQSTSDKEHQTSPIAEPNHIENMERLRNLGLAYILFREDHVFLSKESGQHVVAGSIQELKPYLDAQTYAWAVENAVLLKTESYPEEQSIAYSPLAYDQRFLEKTGRRIIVFMDGHTEIDRNDSLKETLDNAIRFSNSWQLKYLGLELIIWADKNKNVFPNSLEQLPDSDVKTWALENANYQAASKAMAEFTKPSEEILAYDQSLLESSGGASILYADGHIEFHTKSELNKILKKTPEGNSTSGGFGGGMGGLKDKSESATEPRNDVRQILTAAYLFSVPTNFSQVKELISKDKVEQKTITPERFNAFLDAIKSEPKAKLLVNPRILSLDNKEATIEFGDPNEPVHITFTVTNHIAADGKTIRTDVDFERSCRMEQGGITTQQIVSTATLASGYVACAGVSETRDTIELLLVQPTILENQPAPDVFLPTEGGVKTDESGTASLNYNLSYEWKDIPFLLEFAPSTKLVSSAPARDISSYLQENAFEGMIALWLIESVRQKQSGGRGPLNPLCVPADKGELKKEWETSKVIHQQVLAAYQMWWQSVAKMSPDQAAQIDPMQGSAWRWFGYPVPVSPVMAESQSPWGPTTDGISVRLHSPRVEWSWQAQNSGQWELFFKTDLKSKTVRILPHYGAPLDEFYAEVDGRRYRKAENFPDLRSEGPSPATLRQDLYTYIIAKHWRSMSGDQPMPEFTPGRHTIRIIFPLAAESDAAGQIPVAISNPVEIDIPQSPTSSAPTAESEMTGGVGLSGVPNSEIDNNIGVKMADRNEGNKATVKGQVLDADGKPVANQKVELQVFIGGDVDEMKNYHHSYIISDSNGKFEFENIDPGSAHIGRFFHSLDGIAGIPYGLAHSFEIQSGKAYTITLGGQGRPVIGRLIPASDNNDDIVWSKAKVCLDLEAAPWSMGFGADNGKLYRAMVESDGSDLYSRQDIKIQDDGTFQIDNVRAGRYMFRVKLPDGTDRFNLFHHFTVNLMDNGTDSTPLNLGDLIVSHDSYIAPIQSDAGSSGGGTTGGGTGTFGGKQESVSATTESAIERSLEDKLKTGIDLSTIKMGVSLSEAIEHVQNSFDPPLPIVVDWEDLRTNAGVLPTDKARPDNYTRAPAGEALLKILFYVSKEKPVAYTIENGHILIKTNPRNFIERTYTLDPTLLRDISGKPLQNQEFSHWLSGELGCGVYLTHRPYLEGAYLQDQAGLYTDGMLTVMALTEEGHARIAEKIQTLKPADLRQIAIEARFILADESLREEMKLKQEPSGKVVKGLANSDEIKAAMETKPLTERDLPVQKFMTRDGNAYEYIAFSKKGNVKQLSAPKATVLNNESASMRVTKTHAYIDIDNERREIDAGLTFDILSATQDDNKAILLKTHIQLRDILGNQTQTSNGKDCEIPLLQVTDIDFQATAESGKTMVVLGPELTVKEEGTDQTQKQRLYVLLKSTVITPEENE